MDKRILIGAAAVGVVGYLVWSMRTSAQQQVNSTAANTSGSASAVLSGLLSGWANPSSVVPSAQTVAANGTVATPAPAPSPTTSNLPFAVGGISGGYKVTTATSTPSPAPAPKPAAVPAPAPWVPPPPPAPSFDYNPTVRETLQSLLGGYKVTDADAHYWTYHGGIDAVNSTFGQKPVFHDGL